jgi:aquaporin Z
MLTPDPSRQVALARVDLAGCTALQTGNVMSQDNPAPNEPGKDAELGATPTEPVEPAQPAAEAAAAAAAEPAAAEPAAEPVAERPAFTPPAADYPAELAEADEAEYEAAYDVPAGTAVASGPSLLAKLAAEAFGTFFLVLAGLGAALYSNLGSLGGGTLGVALAFGIAVLAGIATVGHISGGHFNPAITFGAALGGRTPWRDLVPYWLAQLVGGTVAAAVLFVAIPHDLSTALGHKNVQQTFSNVANGYGAHSPLAIAVAQGTSGQSHAQFPLVTALLVEVIVTAILVGVVLGVTDRRARRVQAPFAIGLALTALILVALPVTNASLNPARSTAAAIFSQSWALKQLWLFWVAPLVGGAIAGLVYRAFAVAPVKDNLLEEDDLYVTDEEVVVVQER